MIDWQTEAPIIISTSLSFGVDPFFIAAIRGAENGPSGKEYGVEINAPTYQDQLNVACATVRNFIINFHATIFDSVLFDAYSHARLCYSEGLRQAFASKWAPIGVSNDLINLNKNWFNNNKYFYIKFCKQGRIE